MVAIIDIVCIVILVVAAILGAIRGFAKQIARLASGLVAIIGACLLLKPVFDLLYTFDFFKGIVDSLGGAFSGLTFLASYASTLGKTSGGLLAEYVMMLGVFVVLAIVIGLVWKLLKSISFPICDLKFWRFWDRLVGLILGVFWGALLVGGIFYVWSLLKDWSVISTNLPVIGNFYETVTAGESYFKTYVIENFKVVTKFFTDLWNFIKAGV